MRRLEFSLQRLRDMQLSLTMPRFSCSSAPLYPLIELLSKTIVTFVQLGTLNRPVSQRLILPLFPSSGCFHLLNRPHCRLGNELERGMQILALSTANVWHISNSTTFWRTLLEVSGLRGNLFVVWNKIGWSRNEFFEIFRWSFLLRHRKLFSNF